GKEVSVVNTTVYAYDPNGKTINDKGTKQGIPVPIVAWGDKAEHISGMDKGDMLTFSGQAKGIERIPGGPNSGNKPIVQMAYTVNRIDETNTIDKQISSMLIDYNKGEIDQLYEVKEQKKEASKSDKKAKEGKTKKKEKTEPEME
ncbi:MAG: hypothetical protein GX660_26410, partial [Clostridiaceae bacterium]|nr:hypothetical protein [Clostridiaceae bacterium]